MSEKKEISPAKNLEEWEQSVNPFYPKTMKYTREHLIEFAKFHHLQFKVGDEEITIMTCRLTPVTLGS